MRQSTSSVLMIRPLAFRSNEQTALNNFYQKNINNLSAQELQNKVLEEFDNFVIKLREADLEVIVVEDTKKNFGQMDTPDSIFPNNWVSFHQNGEIITYPMFAPNRRLERRKGIFEILENKYNFKISKITDFSNFESQNLFLEGTGSLVLDRENKIAYAALSPRTNKKLVNKLCQHIDYQAITFEAFQKIKAKDEAIYHTNVLMAVAQDLAIICDEAIPNLAERQKVIQSLEQSGKEILRISVAQKNHFAGNMLALLNKKGEKFMIISKQAIDSLNTSQIKQISKKYNILYADIKHIETCGGGSVRCMLAEIFLPKEHLMK